MTGRLKSQVLTFQYQKFRLKHFVKITKRTIQQPPKICDMLHHHTIFSWHYRPTTGNNYGNIPNGSRRMAWRMDI